MAKKTRKAGRKLAAGGSAIALVATGAFFMLGNREAISNIPFIGDALGGEPAVCPLSGREPGNEALLERPAVAVKIENASIAYPLAGLEDAEIVYEELIEGGETRFMALFHCTDADKAGPVRSARMVDPAIMAPYTRILAYSGGNDAVIAALDAAGVVKLDEDHSGDGLERIPREGLSLEHTLYAHTSPLRKLGRQTYDEPPAPELEFGDLEGKSEKASKILISFSGSRGVEYTWSEGTGWLRSQSDVAFMTESGEQLATDNVLIEEHEVDLSDTVVDVFGTPSPEIADVTGSGRALLFRDGRVIRGRWKREAADGPVRFVTKSGDVMVLAPGSTWIELVPSSVGEAKGSFSFER